MSARKPAQQRRVESSRLSVQELEESITRANSELCTLHERKHALLQEQQDHRDRLRAITQHLNELGNEMHSVHRELDTLKIRAYDSFVVKPQPGMETQPGKQPPLPNESVLSKKNSPAAPIGTVKRKRVIEEASVAEKRTSKNKRGDDDNTFGETPYWESDIPDYIDAQRDKFRLTERGAEKKLSVFLQASDPPQLADWISRLLDFLRHAHARSPESECVPYEETMHGVFGDEKERAQKFVWTVNGALHRGLIAVERKRVTPNNPASGAPRAGLAAGSQPAREDLTSAAIVPKDLQPLLDYMRAGNAHVSRRHIRNFFKRAPDSPYGKTSAAINPVMDRARDLGLLLTGGAEDAEWVALPEHDVGTTPDCGLCGSDEPL